MLVGCSVISSDTTKAEAAVKSELRDPSSAQFRDVHLNKLNSSEVCGEVNAKNAFGGYSGFARFAAEKDGPNWRIMFGDGNLDQGSKKFFDALWQGCD
jgi:hypothetical protein